MSISSGINGTSGGVSGKEKLVVVFLLVLLELLGDLAITSESSTEGSRAQR